MSLSNDAKDFLKVGMRKPEAAEEVATAIDAANADSSVTSAKIADGAIVNADINASAAIAFSKLAALPSAQILVGNASNVAAAVAVSGDIAITNGGVSSIASGVIVDGDVNASAAIAFSKLASLPSAQILVGNGSNVAAAVAMSGDISITNAGVTAIASGVIVNADVNASAAIDFSKLAALPSAQILVGNGSNVATAVAMSGDATISNAGALTIGAGAVTRTKQSTAAASKIAQVISGTIATTGDTDTYIIAPETGSLSSAEINPLVALTANDTNYLTFTITNLGQAGGGSTVMLAATDANTTKATGGTGLAINTKRSFTLNGTPANLDVVQGDKLLIRATATGTLDNTVTVPVYCLRFSGTT